MPCRTFRIGGALEAAAVGMVSSRLPLEVCGFACGSQPWVLILADVSHVICRMRLENLRHAFYAWGFEIREI